MRNALLTIFVLFILGTSFSVQAASVQNMDDNAHELLVKENSTSYKVVVEPKGYIEALCSYCTVEVLGYSILDVEDEAVLSIINGRIEVKR